MEIKLKGFLIRVTYPAVALLTFAAVSNLAAGYISCFLAFIIHEAGHLLAMKLCSCKPRGVIISSFDVKILESGRFRVPLFKDIVITLAGPLFNLTAFACTFSANRVFAGVNLCIGLFNLLPALSLDGGQVLYLILSKFFTADTCVRVINTATVIISAPLFFFGIMVLLNSPYNFSLLFIGIYLILSLFLKRDKCL